MVAYAAWNSTNAATPLFSIAVSDQPNRSPHTQQTCAVMTPVAAAVSARVRRPTRGVGGEHHEAREREPGAADEELADGLPAHRPPLLIEDQHLGVDGSADGEDWSRALWTTAPDQRVGSL